jgi:16S rRNA (uracil1498-N3)-methyltransferase
LAGIITCAAHAGNEFLPANVRDPIIPRVLRRVHTPRLTQGQIALDKTNAHHVRDVLRLKSQDRLELFDDSGATARGIIIRCDPRMVLVEVSDIAQAPDSPELIIASAIPKGERADWMVEKLSELGVSRFIPLITARSVVSAAGKNKHHRWVRISTESAKQSRRVGVMQISEPIAVKSFVTNVESKAAYLSTDPTAMPLMRVTGDNRCSLALFIGPEGGWTDEEISLLDSLNLTPARLTATILRVETAAVTAAAIAAVHRDSHSIDS